MIDDTLHPLIMCLATVDGILKQFTEILLLLGICRPTKKTAKSVQYIGTKVVCVCACACQTNEITPRIFRKLYVVILH